MWQYGWVCDVYIYIYIYVMKYAECVNMWSVCHELMIMWYIFVSDIINIINDLSDMGLWFDWYWIRLYGLWNSGWLNWLLVGNRLTGG